MKLSYLTIILTGILVSTLTIFSCNDTHDKVTYIQSHNQDYISRADNIRIVFDTSFVEKTESLNPNVIITVPKINGDLIWVNDNTLELVPKSLLIPNTTYTIKVNPRYLGHKREPIYEFSVKTKQMFINFGENKIIYDDNSIEKNVTLDISISSSDKISTKTLETMSRINVSGAEEGYTLEWIGNDAGVEHKLKISNIDRINEKDLDVSIKLNENIINSTQQIAHTYTVPKPGDFTIMSVETENGQNTQVILKFSHPLEKKDLSGIVYLEGVTSQHKYEIQSNKLVVYIDDVLVKNHNLIIEEGLKSAVNNKGIDPQVIQLHFEKIPPSIRLTQNGTILPNSDQLYFPFEAVGLNAVFLEIIKIPNYNLNQFSQVNPLSNSSELYRVGDVVVQEKIELNMISSEINTSKWKKYALDLNEYIKSDQSAMYHIILSFKPSYTVQPCSQAIGDEFNKRYRYNQHELSTMMDVPYYGFGSSEDYDYYDDDNPCKGSYYTSDRWITQNIIASNLGIIAKMGIDKKLFIKALSINDLNPQASVNIEIYTYQNKLLRTKKTDPNGEANFDFSMIDDKPFLIKAFRGNDFMYIRLADGQALSTSLFDTEGIRFKEGQKAYIFTERGVWRPGDKVHLNAIIENEQQNYDAPIRLEVYNPRNKLIHTDQAIYGKNGFYALPFSTSSTDITGNYRAEISIGNSTFYTTIPIETIKPNRLKIRLDKDNLSADFSSKILEIPLSTEWLHGGKASNLEYKTELKISEVNFNPKSYSQYSFSKFKSASSFSKEISGKTDASGNALIKVEIPTKSRYNGIPVFNFSTRVMEPSGEFSVDNISVMKPIFDKYIGANINSDKYNYHLVKVNENATINLIALDNNEKKIENAQGEINIYKVTWHWWWESSSSSSSARNSTTKKLVKTIPFNLKNESDYNIDFMPEESGRYEIDICLNSGHCAQKYLYSVDYDYFQKAKFQNPTELPLQIDKDKYEIDESVQLTIQGEKGQKAFISLESGTGVISQMTKTLEKPEQTFEIQIPKGAEPGFYISVFLIQSRNDLTIDIPLRRYGLIYVPVENKEHILEPVIKTTDFYEPNQTVNIDISEKTGNAMTYSVFMVDDGLLDLTHHLTPAPLSYFMSKEAHTLKTWDNYDLVMGPYQNSQRLLAIGGGGDISADELSKLSRFQPVSIQIGPFTLEKGETATHKIDIPNYIGSVRLMVVARNKNQYGSAEKTVKVKKDLMVLGTAARRLGIGDKMVMPVTIFADSDKINTVSVSLDDIEGNYSFPSGSNQTVQMNGEGEKTIYFDVSTANNEGMSPLKITASSGNLISVDQINMPVINTHQPVREVSYQIISGNSSQVFNLPRIGIDNTRKANLYISSVLNPKFESRIQRIINYPYGCNEQTASTAFTALLARDIINYTDLEKSKLDEMITESIKVLDIRQMSNGAWALWGNTNVDPWVTSYIGHFLYEAADKGYKIPTGMMEKWFDYQKKTAGIWNKNIRLYGNNRSISDISQAYRLYTLALWNQPQLSDMNRLAEDKQRSTGASNFLAATYSKIGRTEKAENLYKAGNIKDTGTYYSSRLRNLAIQTMIQHVISKDDEAIKTFQAMQNEINSRYWMSTQEVVFSLLAIRNIYGDIDSDSSIEVEYSVNNSNKKSLNSDKLLISEPLAITDREYGTNKSVLVTNKSNAPINVSLMLEADSRDVDKFMSTGIKVSNRYFNSDKKEIDISRVKSGSDIIVETTLERVGNTSINNTLDQVVISQIFPSAWQILESGLSVNQEKTQTRFIYQDVRDDRVHTVLDLYSGKNKFVVKTKINVTYSGEYYLPSTIAETMYDPGYYTQTAGKRIIVDRI